MRIILGITALIGVLLPLFFARLYQLPGQWKWVGGLLSAFGLLSFGSPLVGYDRVTMAVMWLGFAAALYQVARAVQAGRKGSFLSLLGVLPIPLSILW